MTAIILAIWAATAVAGTVTAVVCFKKRRRPEAICDTCAYLQIRNDHNDPRDGTTWQCSYGRGRCFTDPPEFCAMYHQRSRYGTDLVVVRGLERPEVKTITSGKECELSPETLGYVWEV